MFSGVTHETSVLCSKLCSNYVGLKWHFHPTPHRLLPLSKYSQSFSFENKLGSLAKCTGYTNLRYQVPKIFPLLSTLYILERVHSFRKQRHYVPKILVLCQHYAHYAWCSRYSMWWANLTSPVPVVVLITRVIYRSKLHFAVAWNIVYKSRKCRAYRTISYKICGIITLFETTWT